MPDAPPVTMTLASRRLGYVANEGSEEDAILAASRQSGLGEEVRELHDGDATEDAERQEVLVAADDDL